MTVSFPASDDAEAGLCAWTLQVAPKASAHSGALHQYPRSTLRRRVEEIEECPNGEREPTSAADSRMMFSIRAIRACGETVGKDPPEFIRRRTDKLLPGDRMLSMGSPTRPAQCPTAVRGASGGGVRRKPSPLALSRTRERGSWLKPYLKGPSPLALSRTRERRSWLIPCLKGRRRRLPWATSPCYRMREALPCKTQLR
jgi:hypothetical protein